MPTHDFRHADLRRVRLATEIIEHFDRQTHRDLRRAIGRVEARPTWLHQPTSTRKSAAGGAGSSMAAIPCRIASMPSIFSGEFSISFFGMMLSSIPRVTTTLL